MYQHILAPIDGSESAVQGLREAIRLAADQKARLRLMYVIDTFPILVGMASAASLDPSLIRLRNYGEQLLSAAKKLAGESGVDAETVLREVTEGRIANAVVEEAGVSGCDLIVMGTHGARGIEKILLGSVAERVLKRAACPVLIVNPYRGEQGYRITPSHIQAE